MADRGLGILRRWWFPEDTGGADPSGADQERSGTIPLVCVRHHQDVVAGRAPGDRLYLVREHGNPYDAEAIVAVDIERATLGLIGRDSWLHEPLLKKGAGCFARIAEISRGASGLLGVLIHVELSGPPIGMRAYRQPISRAHSRSLTRAR